jgi:hypothetical protein
MIIANQNTVDPQPTETQQQRQEKKDVQRSSDRFANMLDSQKKQQQQIDKLANRANKEQALKLENKAETASSAGFEEASAGSGSPSAQIETSNLAVPAPTVPQDIQKLAEEFGHQIQLHQLGNKNQMVDIAFHSKTLPGLKVQIQHSKGRLAIRFLSQSVTTTQLLAKHTASLKQALESKGLNIASITLAGSRYPTSLAGSRDATI